jgi:BMFP domain-containing protein YqiC
MNATTILEDLQSRIAQLLAQSPAKDLEQNVRALLRQGFSRLDLATREELDLQTELLSRARARLSELEARVSALEERLPKG